jgi:hypothetical protein
LLVGEVIERQKDVNLLDFNCLPSLPGYIGGREDRLRLLYDKPMSMSSLWDVESHP